jgi:hypothetical protein
MNTNWKKQLPTALVAALVLIALIALAWRPAEAQRPKAKGAGLTGPRYSVIETQGFNLLVADNAENKLYYYATDKDVPVGAPLKLRASLDLTKVGMEEIAITPHNLENIRKKETKK